MSDDGFTKCLYILQNVYILCRRHSLWYDMEILNIEYNLRSLKVVHISNFGALK